MNIERYLKELQFLIDDENEAIDGYLAALEFFDNSDLREEIKERVREQLEHIKEEEEEHIQELDELVALIREDGGGGETPDEARASIDDISSTIDLLQDMGVQFLDNSDNDNRGAGRNG